MANATPTRLGQALAAGATDALFLDLFEGEVLTAYETSVKFAPTVRSKTISGGKSYRFPALYRAVGQYHVPGTEIAGQNILGTEITISTDDLLVAPVEIAQIDELRNHFDVRAPYTRELGNALALIDDRITSMSILKAARSAELFAGDGGGGSVQESDISGSADFTTSGADLWAAFGQSVRIMDEKDVPVESSIVHGAVLPLQWYLMAQSEKNINKDYGAGGSINRNVLNGVSGVQVMKSNALLFGKDVTAYNASTNTDGLVGKPNDIKYGLPANFPAKYQADLSGSTGTVGLAWTDAAVARLQLLGVATESEWDIRRQVTLMLAKMSVAAGVLRGKCAVEIKRT
jgi:hypothetical protein